MNSRFLIQPTQPVLPNAEKNGLQIRQRRATPVEIQTLHPPGTDIVLNGGA